MKKFLIALLILGVASLACAGDKALIFQWGHDAVDLDGFRLYYSVTSGNYTDSHDILYIPDAENPGSFLSENFKIAAPDGAETTYYFTMTAYDDQGNESVPSNEVSAIIDFKSPNQIFDLTVEIEISN
jgi:hypothetical protein